MTPPAIELLTAKARQIATEDPYGSHLIHDALAAFGLPYSGAATMQQLAYVGYDTDPHLAGIQYWWLVRAGQANHMGNRNSVAVTIADLAYPKAAQ